MRTTILFILASCALLLQAAPIDMETAQKTASAFFAKEGKLLAPAKRVHKAPRKQKAIASVQETAYYYVFNADNNGGFVIISGDDSTAPVLGYADKGHFDEESIPDNMKAWLQGYADQMEAMAARQSSATTRANEPVIAESVKKAVPPLLTSLWNQDTPYNNACPEFFNDGRCVTGCVATAMAQVVYHHRVSMADNEINELQADIPAYDCNTDWGGSGKIHVDEIAARESSLDWENMKDRYSYADDATAVANLMFYCGAAVQMDYRNQLNGGSSAQLSAVPHALKTYFGFNPKTTCVDRQYYTIASWKDLIYQELISNRPVIYDGQSSGGGHVFVIDGYDGEDLFHINWGWGGVGNGYFLLQVANPNSTTGIGSSSTKDGYSMDQNAIIHADLSETETSFSATLKSCQGTTVVFDFVNNTEEEKEVECGVGFVGEGGVVTLVKHWGSASRELSAGSRFNDISFSVTASDFSGMPVGTYQLVGIVKESGSSEWRECLHNPNEYVSVAYNGSTVTLTTLPVQTLTVLTVTGFNIPDPRMAGIPVQVDAAIRNLGDEFNGKLYLFASTTTEMGTNVNHTGAALAEGEESTVSFWFTPDASATYNLWVATDEAGTDIIGTTTLYIQPLTLGSLTLETITFDNGTTDANLGGTLYGSYIKGEAVLKNNGTDTFASSIIISLYKTDSKNFFEEYDRQTFTPTIAAGGSAAIHFNFQRLDKTAYTLHISYLDDTTIKYLPTYNYYVLVPGVEVFTADGQPTAVAATPTVTIPDDAVAVDIAGVASTISTITPNSNPNTLYYIGANETAPDGLEHCNIVKGSVAEKISLKSGYDFMAPYNFTAEEISYQLMPTIGSTGSGGWQTMVLPFAVQFTHCNNETIDWFHNDDDADKQFWARRFAGFDDNNTILFGYTDVMEANEPYIVAFSSDIVGKTVEFIGQNALIRNDAMMRVTTSGANFEGTTVSTPVSSCYTLDAAGKTFNRGDVTVQPFQGYFLKKSTDEQPLQLDAAFMITLADKAGEGKNSSIITANVGQKAQMTLAGRKLYKDDAWNTLCLPFNLVLEGSPLAGAEARMLTDASISGSTLTLNFSLPVSELTAGTPYIIKWTGTEGTLTGADLVFNGVTIDNTMNDKKIDGVVTFKGTYDAQRFTEANKSILFMNDKNTLNWPEADATIGACRAYFQLADGITAADVAAGARLFFGSDESQGIISIENGKLNIEDVTGSWYTVNGVKVENPVRKGLYILNGRKVVIK